MVAWHITNNRHTILLLPFIAFLIAYAISRIGASKLIIKASIISLLLVAGYLTTYHMPNYRQKFNTNGKDFMPLAKIIKEKKAIKNYS